MLSKTKLHRQDRRRNFAATLTGWMLLLSATLLALATVFSAPANAADSPSEAVASTDSLAPLKALAESYCIDCHNSAEPEAGLNLEAFDFGAQPWDTVDFKTDTWEKILRRLDTRQMPPVSAHRPSDDEYVESSKALRQLLDRRSKAFPRPGKGSAIRRLTRMEYQNSIRDLLGIEIDAKEYLPKDESSHGFDNITVEELSPMHLNRYLTAAQAISRAAVGGKGNGPVGVTIRQPADRSQETHVAGLPFGTRGGAVFRRHFHRSGEYEVELKLTRDRDEKIEGLNRQYHIDVLVDRARKHQFVVAPVKGKGGWKGDDYTHADSHLHARIHIDAGTHTIGVTFPKTFSSLAESKRQPFDANYNRHRHPRRTPAIYQISIVGPLETSGDGDVDSDVDSDTGTVAGNNGDLGAGKTHARALVFGQAYDSKTADPALARRIVSRIASRAYRRPVDDEDIDLLLQFFDAGNSEGGFEHGIESSLAAILVNPNFLFRIESHDDAIAKGAHPLGDYELATRLSYFLWSSLPDQRLLSLAESGTLQDVEVLRAEVRRMLDDPRSLALVDNFATQWLYLKNLETITPDLRLFPDFDDNLRQAFREETKLLFQDVLRRDQSVMRLIQSDTTFLNQRLATHYGIEGVRGSMFRPVTVSTASHRGGILRHGSVLMVTSYATRTSPTIRGNWILENIFGTPAPPPPANVPNLKENTALEVSSVRERLAQHRKNPACASCHDLMDPVGFALENFDAVGRWRQFDGSLLVDSRGQLPDGTRLKTVDELEAGILARPEIFAQTLTEKLMTYGLGRAIGPDDLPAVRSIVQASAAPSAEQDRFKLSSLLTGIVLSDAFRKWSPMPRSAAE